MLQKLRQNKFIYRRLLVLIAFLFMATVLSLLLAAFGRGRPACKMHPCTYRDDLGQALPIAYAWAAALWAFYGTLAIMSSFLGTVLKKISKK